jgi:soluble lytic murein transglycosylase-like protein
MRMRFHFVIRRFVPLFGAGLALAWMPEAARADVATLKSGRTIEVASFRLNGDRVELSLPGGGEIALPAGEVREIRRQPLSAEPTPATPTALPAVKGESGAAIEPPGSLAAEAPGSPDRSSGTAPANGAMSAETTPAGNASASPIPNAVAEAEDLLPGGATDRRALMRMASKIARRHGVAEPLVHAVIEVESKYNPKAVSRAGAMGLMQLMPKTANRFSVADAFDPVQNVDAGVRYLKELLERYSGQVRLALAAYNAGEEAVERHGGIPPYRETIDYVRRVQRVAAR